MKYLTLIFIFLGFLSCKEKVREPSKKAVDYYNLPTFVNDTLQAVIEIPAGTNKKIEYHIQRRQFIVDSINHKPRSIEYLPYLGNYGFIPSTYSDPKKGGDGDALDILVLSESTPSGSIIKVIPIGVLRLDDNGESDDKIIAVPAQLAQQILPIKSFEELSLNYPEIRKMISLWFQNYNPNDKVTILSFNGEDTALSIIKKWSKH